jgi:hypothetical protein
VLTANFVVAEDAVTTTMLSAVLPRETSIVFPQRGPVVHTALVLPGSLVVSMAFARGRSQGGWKWSF